MKILGPVAMGLTCLGLSQACWSDDAPPPKPLNLLLTRDELRAIAERYVWVAPEPERANELEQVTVKAPSYLAPMRDPSQDVAGGIAAPFWALAHPKDAWRIFLPIPPKDNPQ
jgi:hypothetical protein